MHGTAVVTYWEKSRKVGERTQYCCGASDSGNSFSAYWPHTAYFCPKCGEIWGREIFNYEFQYSPRVSNSWTIESRRCVECGDGQFLVGKDALLPTCSLDLLKREYYVLTKGLSPQATLQHQDNPPERQAQRLVSARERFQTAAEKGV